MDSRGRFGSEGGYALSELAMNGVRLIQNRRGLAMEA